MTEPTDPAIVLDCPMQDGNDAGASTVRDYLARLLLEVWAEQDNFNGKRPFGNSGWSGDFEVALVSAGLVDGNLDEDGYIDDVDYTAVDRLIRSAIVAMGGTT